MFAMTPCSTTRHLFSLGLLVSLLSSSSVLGLSLSSPLSLLPRSSSLWRSAFDNSAPPTQPLRRTTPNDNFNNNANSGPPLWILQDIYQGQDFFDLWDFQNFSDPTHGQVQYLDRQSAMGSLAYVTPDDKVIMQVDNWTTLPAGALRDSVRISSQKVYTGGLFILDLNQAPWGCGVWPAFWTVGPNWPYGGEIDIMEGVQDNEHNQVSWHTSNGCYLTNPGNFTGTVVGTSCTGLTPDNSGCGIVDWSRSSYGPQFDSYGGGAYAMKWDEDGISVWFFYRAGIPEDVLQGTPQPDTWGLPSANLAASACSPTQYFQNHSIVFDITFCGDWAGSPSSYNASGCPGTCTERIMDPANFVNASWSINNLSVYSKTFISGQIVNSSVSSVLRSSNAMLLGFAAMLLSFGLSLL